MGFHFREIVIKYGYGLAKSYCKAKAWYIEYLHRYR